MSFAVIISGSPGPRSRSGHLAGLGAEALRRSGVRVRAYSVRDFAPEALLHADFGDPAIARFREEVALADGVIVSTPVYKAAYSGALKLMLDVLPERALVRAAVLPLATGGSAAHMLAVDYALRPVLVALKARHVAEAFYATDREATWTEEGGLDIAPELHRRWSDQLARFVASVAAVDPGRRGQERATPLSPVPAALESVVAA